MAEIPTSALPLDLIAPAMTGQPGVQQKSTPPDTQQASTPGFSSDILTNSPVKGVQRADFATMLAQLRPADGSEQLNRPAPSGALNRISFTTLPPSSAQLAGTLPPEGAPADLDSALALVEGGNTLPQSGNDLPPVAQDDDAPPQTETRKLPEADLQAVANPAPMTPLSPTSPTETGAAAALVKPLQSNASGTPPPAANPVNQSGQSGAGQSAATVNLTPTTGAETGGSSADQSGEFNFNERQQAEFAARLGRDQAPDDGRQELSRTDTRLTTAAEFTKAEPNPLTLPLNATRPGGLEATGTQTLTLSLPADKANWAQPLADRIALMISKGGNTAELRLNPPHLGRLEVQFTVNGDQASIVLTTASPEIRDALQQSLPRLETLLQNSGLQLADSHITDQQSGQAEESGSEQAFGSGIEDVVEPTIAKQSITSGLIDTYA